MKTRIILLTGAAFFYCSSCPHAAEALIQPPGIIASYQLPSPEARFIARTRVVSSATFMVSAQNALPQFEAGPDMKGVRYRTITYTYAGGSGTATFTLDPFAAYDWETLTAGWQIAVEGDLTEATMKAWAINLLGGGLFDWRPAKYQNASDITATFLKVPYSDGINEETWTLSNPVQPTPSTFDETTPWSDWIETTPTAHLYQYTSDTNPVSGWSRGEAEYRLLASPTMTGQTIPWAEIRTVQDDPDTAQDESLVKDLTSRSWMVDATQSQIYLLSPTLAGDYIAMLVALPVASISADLNRDGTISLPAESLADLSLPGRPFRFWVNDDDDSGDTRGSDIPGNAIDPNYSDGVINGTRDLVDFYPVFLDLKQLLTVLPPSDSIKYKLKQENSAVNFVYTNITRNRALAYQTEILTTGFSDAFNSAPGTATTHQVTAAGVELSSPFLTGVKDSDWGVLLIEGRSATTAPLVLSVEKAGTTIAEVKLELRISNVEEMFRHLDLTDVPRAYNGDPVAPPVPASPTRTGDPGVPYPDSDTNGKYFVFIHGFNVNGQRARGWNAEVFKRLYQMGSHARFVGVTWNGATGLQLPNGSYTDYHQAAFHAFQTGDELGLRLAAGGVTGDVTIAAHSLGNMVASQAIQYGGFSPARYYMINAAVPVEAYHVGSVGPGDLARMTHVGWKNAPLSNGAGRLFAANWHLLFYGTGDHRSELTWKERFSNIVPIVHDFYSPGDEVVEDPTMSSPSLLLTALNQGFSSAHGAWGLQELAKGTFSIASAFFSRTQAGWGESGYSISQPEDANPSDASLKVQPFFAQFFESDLLHPDATIASTKAGLKNVQYDLLARGIPALSFAAAVHKLVPLDSTDRNFDMETDGRIQNQWPTEGHTSDDRDAGRWLHSDFKNVALPYVFKMYREMINRGSLQ